MSVSVQVGGPGFTLTSVSRGFILGGPKGWLSPGAVLRQKCLIPGIECHAQDTRGPQSGALGRMVLNSGGHYSLGAAKAGLPWGTQTPGRKAACCIPLSPVGGWRLRPSPGRLGFTAHGLHWPVSTASRTHGHRAVFPVNLGARTALRGGGVFHAPHRLLAPVGVCRL